MADLDLESIRARANTICGLPQDCLTHEQWRAVQTDIFTLIHVVDCLQEVTPIALLTAVAENERRAESIMARAEERQQQMRRNLHSPGKRFNR